MPWGYPESRQMLGPRVKIKIANAPPPRLKRKRMPRYCLGGWVPVELTDALYSFQKRSPKLSALVLRYLKENKDNNLHLARKYARIFVLGHYLFLAAHSFPRASFS